MYVVEIIKTRRMFDCYHSEGVMVVLIVTMVCDRFFQTRRDAPFEIIQDLRDRGVAPDVHVSK